MMSAVCMPKDDGFQVQGMVGFENVIALRHQGENCIAHCITPSITVDLSDLKELDASCFSLFLCWMRYANTRSRSIRFINLSPSLLRIQHMLGLTHLMVLDK